MKEYVFKQTNPFVWIATLVLLIFVGLFFLIFIASIKLFNGSPMIIVVGVMIPFIILAFIIPNKIATQEVHLFIDEKGIIKQNLQTTGKPSSLIISWDDISEYVFQKNRQFDKLMINTKNGKRLLFFHNNDVKDDFMQFFNDFESKISSLNQISNFKKIAKGKNIYESQWGLVLAALSVIAIVLILIIFFYHLNKNTNTIGLVIVLFGALFILGRVIFYRIK